MNNNYFERDLATRIYELDSKIYKATGSTLGKVFPAVKTVSVNQIIQQLRSDKNRFLKTEMILLSNMLNTLPDSEEYETLLEEYQELEDQIYSYDADAYNLTAGLKAIRQKGKPIPPGEKIIVCLSRQYGCRGQETGVALAKRTGLTFYDKDILSIAARHYNMDLDAFDGYDPSESAASSSFWIPRFPKLGSLAHDKLFFMEREMIQKIAQEENCIFLGRCADHILKQMQIPHISIFLCAPFEKRVLVEMSRFDCTQAQAKKNIQQFDRSRQAFYKYYTNSTWGSPELYNACLNTSIYGVEGTVDLIQQIIQIRYEEA